jgi:pimeloyl-ACP methyl ester carboxylesterase
MKRQLTKLEEFLITDEDYRSTLMKDEETRSAVQAWMGVDAFNEYLRHNLDNSHLGGGDKNIVFAPGVMGSTLQSDGLGGVWWLDMVRARDKLNQLQLSDDGKNDVDSASEVMPGAVDISYVPFRKAIATSQPFGGSLHFPYDWRKSYLASVDRLRDTIVRAYSEYRKPIHLAGHSMGGLMIRSTLMRHGKELWPKVGKIAFIGTPHYGSPSIAGYLKNHLWGTEGLAILAMFLSRETFRTLRGVLSLLPAPRGIYPGTRAGEEHPCANFDLYDAQAWKLDLNAAQSVNLQQVLDEVDSMYKDLYAWHGSLLQEYKDRMLMIAGVGQKTLFRLEFDSQFLGMWEHTDKIKKREPCNPNREGDGRVPLASAQLEDVTLRYVNGEHGSLPNIPAVTQDVISWFTEGKLRLAETCQGALAGHLSGAGEDRSATPLLDGSHETDYFREFPEYGNPTPQFRKDIESKLSGGEFTLINFVKIL